MKKKQPFFKRIKIYHIITMLSAGLALIAIFAIIKQNPYIASILMLICFFLDGIDGRLARLFKASSEFGKQLDSLSDIIAFGAAPAVFGFVIIADKIPPFIVYFCLIFFLLSGIYRLARFNLQKNTKFFIGMPITINGLIFPLLYFLKTPFYIYPFIFVLSGILMISRFKIKKFL